MTSPNTKCELKVSVEDSFIFHELPRSKIMAVLEFKSVSCDKHYFCKCESFLNILMEKAIGLESANHILCSNIGQ